MTEQMKKRFVPKDMEANENDAVSEVKGAADKCFC
jgi:hypothetical protein